MKRKEAIALSVAVTLALISLILIIFTPVRLGLDLKGGMQVVLAAQSVDGTKVTEQQIEQAQVIVQERVNGLGVTEPLIERQIGSNNIIIQLPGIKRPQEALRLIKSTAVLEFKPVISQRPFRLGPTLMTGKALSSARVDFDQLGRPKVDLQFNAEGAQRFEQITGQLVGKQLAIVLDKKVISAPVVQQKISGGRAEITGKFTTKEASNLALILNTGALPVKLKVQQQQIIGPTLGQDSLKAALAAGLAGLVIVALYMLVMYRGLGLISIMALTVFALLFGGVLTLIGTTLTLPGIAGIILTIGLAADSGIVFFERFREEFKRGGQPRAAARVGFTHAFRTIMDADATTLIIAGTLMALSYFYFGAGPVRGFAFTLSIGIATDVFTAYLFTRSALVLLSDLSVFKNPVFIGVKREGQSREK